MSRDALALMDYLGHMLEAVGRIQKYVDDVDEVSFLSNRLVQDAVIRNFEIVGEASNNIEKYFPQFSLQHPDLPLAVAYQMRNSLVHGYFKVDLELIWQTIQVSLPPLHTQLISVLSGLRSQ
jgi:uncharacterized protein with HEPN domain